MTATAATRTDQLTADLAVIGFGKAGKTLAATLGKAGQRVVLVEQSPRMYGGTCINIGCVPTKSMVYRSEHLPAGTVHTDDYCRAIEVTDELTSQLRAGNLAMLTTIPTVTVLTGRARFVDPHTLVVAAEDGSTVRVSATHIVVGTGSEPVIPDVPGLRECAATVTSTTLLATPGLPRRLVVLGGGYVGIEFAAMYARYGAQVTVVDHNPRILVREDEDVAQCAAAILAQSGLTLLTGATITRVDEAPGSSAVVHYERDGESGCVEADLVLAALGRRPVTEDLGLAEAGVDTTARGAIAVDEHLRTSQPHIFAVGDVNGGPQFTYISLDDYRIVLDQLRGTGTRSTADRVAVPYSLFMTPPLSRVGVTEREARASGRRVKMAVKPVAELATMPRARIVDDPRGLMKVVVDAETDEILGAALLSHDSHEVINTVALAVRHGITASALRDAIYTHPSMTEGFNQLLGALV